METTLYDDSSFRISNNMLKPTKRPATLDLESPSSKRQKFAAILTSPDLNMLKLASPELERFIIASNGALTTPTSTQNLFPKSVTEEQERYAKGFVDALALLHQSGNFSHLMENVTITSSGLSPIASAAISSSGAFSPLTATLTRNFTGLIPSGLQSSSVSTAFVSSTTKPSSSNVMLSSVRPPSVESSSSSSYPGTLSISLPSTIVKEEPQTVPSDNSSLFGTSPPLSPINLEDQERIKLERKRSRNRIAATKCRQRKIERISKLEEKVKELKTDNAKLESTLKELRDVICGLKREIINHVKFGCQIMLPHITL